jgi:hypothetical protein
MNKYENTREREHSMRGVDVILGEDSILTANWGENCVCSQLSASSIDKPHQGQGQGS